jgi:hypothetical protein
MKRQVSLFGVIHLEDRTLIFWSRIEFFACRAWYEKQSKPHYACHACECGELDDAERNEARAFAWLERQEALAQRQAA